MTAPEVLRYPAPGRLTSEQLAALAELAQRGDGRVELLAGGGLRLPGVSEDDAADHPVLAGLRGEPATGRVTGTDGVGWRDQTDGLVRLTAVVADHRLSARLIEFLAAVAMPVEVTERREIVLADLEVAAAEAVVRVLAPMGLIFDADSPWATAPSDGDR